MKLKSFRMQGRHSRGVSADPLAPRHRGRSRSTGAETRANDAFGVLPAPLQAGVDRVAESGFADADAGDIQVGNDRLFADGFQGTRRRQPSL